MSRESFLNRDRDHGTASHRRAPKHEQETAKKLGGIVTRGSGNGRWEKGDVRVKGVVRIENKTTKTRSFSVSVDHLDKIETAALAAGEMPAMVIELDNRAPRPRQFAVLPLYALETLLANQKE